ncbi:MAG TPA: nucleoside hydrolase [Chloroflexia bacterium]|nr:nucleoside hydrolase [Chloroflexia bacterium]
MAEKIVLDVDTGVDDALAILLALNSPEVEVLACTTVAGNVTVDQTTLNTLMVLEAAGRSDIPVAKGATRPLARRLTTATYFHGPTGLGRVELPAPTISPVEVDGPHMLLNMANRFAGELTVVAVGPLTNLALALLIDPDFGRKLKRLVIMGGAVRTQGNITPVAEANFYNDPEAAQAVLHCGAPITLVGLDVTHQSVIYWNDIAFLDDHLATLSPTGRLSLELLRFYTQCYGATGGAHLHDPLAVGVVLQPDLVTTERMQVDIETHGRLTRGQSVGYSHLNIDLIEDKGDYDDAIGIRVEHPSNAEVCLEVKADEFVQIFRERLGLKV